MRSFISPVDRTSISSRWASGHRSISVSSMCMAIGYRLSAIGSELDPRQFARFDSHATKYSLSTDARAKDVFAGRHVGDGEVLVVHGVGVVFRAVGLDVRERRFSWLHFD